MAPFDNFRVSSTGVGDNFVIRVKVFGSHLLSDKMGEFQDRSMNFVEAAIQEKLDREHAQHSKER